MDYAFDLTAASKDAAKTAIAASLASIPDATNRAAVIAAAGTFVDLLQTDATHDVSVMMRGVLAMAPPAGMRYCDVRLTVALVERVSV